MKVSKFDALTLPFAAAMESDFTYEIPIRVDRELSEDEERQLRLAIDKQYIEISKVDEFLGYNA